MIDTIKQIHRAAGSPNLNTHDAADHFTAVVAATLHFGAPSLNIRPDPRIGRRRNPSGILSDDVIGINEDGRIEYFDYIRGAGANNWEFVWQGSSGGPWVAPDDPRLVVTGEAPDPDPDPGPSNNNPPPPVDLTAIVETLKAIKNVTVTLALTVATQNTLIEALLNAQQQGQSPIDNNLLIEIRDAITNTRDNIVAESKSLRDLVRGGVPVRIQLR